LSTYQPQAIQVLDPCHVQAQALAFEEGPFYFAVEVPGFVGLHWVRWNSLARSEVQAENLLHQAEWASEIKGDFKNKSYVKRKKMLYMII